MRQVDGNLSKELDSILQVVNNMVDLHDPAAAGHQTGVALLARAIAQEMGGNKDLADCVYLAGRVHDIGKIMIPSEILSSPHKLNHLQQMIVMQHPQISYDLLKSVDLPGYVLNAVHQHHERLDGSGYPCGLCGDQILMESRILAVADVIQAMVTCRSYRQPLMVSSVLEELDAHRGTLYDSAVVDTYKRLDSVNNSNFS
jgi:HD-GYP domain-containing protein (c-di-GMP phosphodiesterase class II)